MKTAILTFRLLSGDPCSSQDIILLDRAVRIAATERRPRLPVIFLREISRSLSPTAVVRPRTGPSGEHQFHLDLERVPIRFLSPDDPVPRR